MTDRPPSGPRRRRHRGGRRTGRAPSRAPFHGDAAGEGTPPEGAPIDGNVAERGNRRSETADYGNDHRDDRGDDRGGERGGDRYEDGYPEDRPPGQSGGQSDGHSEGQAPRGQSGGQSDGQARGNRGRGRGPRRPPRHPVNPDGMEQRCVRQFPRVALIRGRQYFQSGHVSDATQLGEAFSLTVHGRGERYNIWIDFSQAASGTIEARCSCPFYATGGLCKHLWASVIKIERSGLSEKVPGTGPLRMKHDGKGAQPAREGRGPAPFVVPRSHPQQGPTAWLDRLEQIQGKGAAGVTSMGNLLAAFVIPAAETLNAGKLILDFWSQRRGPAGETGPLRPGQVPRDPLLFADARDQEVVALLSRTGAPKVVTSFGSPCSRFTVDSILETQILTTLAGAGKVYLSRSPNGSPDNADRPLRLDRGKPWDLELKVEAAGNSFRLEATLKRDEEYRSIADPVCVLRSGLMIFGERIGRLAEARHASWLGNLRGGEFIVPHEQGDLLLKRILTDSTAPKVTWPEGMGWKRRLIDPIPKGVFRPLGNDPSTGRMSMTMSFDYGGHEISLGDQSESILDTESHQVYSRNRVFEESSLNQALEILRDPAGTVPVADLMRAATALGACGWVVFIENHRVVAASDFAMNITSTTDWFDVTLEASFGGSPVLRDEILAALEAKSSFVRLKDGSLGMLPEEWLTRYATLKGLGKKNDDGSLRFGKAQGLLLDAALGDDENIRGDKNFTAFRDRILEFDLAKTAKAPTGFKGKLRNYQKEGLTWLGFLKEFESGGILADDMGLGKTIQVLAFLLSRRKETKLPSLVVAPKSLVFNWIDEAQKFAPTLNVVRYAGDGRQKLAHEIAKADLVVTTYGTLRTDIDKLREMEFDVAIVDEAQFIKNPKALSAIACKQLRAVHRLALTGTPIENSIGDLLSILEFTNPGLLHFPVSDGPSDEMLGKLAQLLRPFMLRRTKEAVLTELPEKSEQVLFCEMSREESEFYAVIRDRYRDSIEKSVETNGLAKSKMHVLEALLRLRQASCHAGLIDETKRWGPSAKVELLLAQLKEIIAEGHKALVFSQFTSLLSIVKQRLDADGIVYEYLDGQTDDRQTPVERFQSDAKVPVFLISLKAGGTGLNLTAADYVFILDPWWNPAVEAQAIGRAHRMGQEKPVFAYRMVARGTVEEKILELQKKKKALAESIISEDTDFMKKLSREDLENLLAP